MSHMNSPLMIWFSVILVTLLSIFVALFDVIIFGFVIVSSADIKVFYFLHSYFFGRPRVPFSLMKILQCVTQVRFDVSISFGQELIYESIRAFKFAPIMSLRCRFAFFFFGRLNP